LSNVFESEAAAQAVASQEQPPDATVTVDSVEVGEIVASA
jgi:hypothetical protein